jgi:flagellar protein FliO/FliZ
MRLCKSRILVLLLVLMISTSGPVCAADTTPVSPSAGLLQIFFGLIAVLALMGVAAWFFKRLGPIANGHQVQVKVVGGVNVGNRERVMVIEVADQWIVVGVTAQQITTLTTMPKQEKELPDTSALVPEKMFSTWLKRTLDKRNQVQK